MGGLACRAIGYRRPGQRIESALLPGRSASGRRLPRNSTRQNRRRLRCRPGEGSRSCAAPRFVRHEPTPDPEPKLETVVVPCRKASRTFLAVREVQHGDTEGLRGACPCNAEIYRELGCGGDCLPPDGRSVYQFEEYRQVTHKCSVATASAPATKLASMPSASTSLRPVHWCVAQVTLCGYRPTPFRDEQTGAPSIAGGRCQRC